MPLIPHGEERYVDLMDEDFFERLAREAEDASLTFMVVGGHAVNAYGYQRTTIDVDLLIAESALGTWRTFWERRGYRCVHTTDAFCQFRTADETERFPVDLMVVSDETFGKLRSKEQRRAVGGCTLPVPSPLHLIALKLHALSNKERARQGMDLPDIIGLIRGCGIDTQDVELQEILERYADEKIRSEIEERLRSS